MTETLLLPFRFPFMWDAFLMAAIIAAQTVLAALTMPVALALAGLKVCVSCKQGICGSCLTDVLEGEPDHRDHYLTDEEKADGDQILLCCSRAKSARLIIDL